MTTQRNSVRKAEAAPTLRERAERLRDAAGRFVRRNLAEPPPVVAEGSEAAADPILVAIAETERLTAVRNAAADLPLPQGRLDPLPEQDAAQDAFWAHVDGVLLKTVPATGAGCTALARYAIDFLKRDSFVLDEHEGNEHVRILDLIARSPLLDASLAPSADPFEGTSCPPGFVPYPFDKPVSYASIQGVVIPAEAQRLLDLARAEEARRLRFISDDMPEAVRAERHQGIRSLLRLDALDALVSSDKDNEPGTTPDHDAPVTLEGAASLSFEAYAFDDPILSPTEWGGRLNDQILGLLLMDRLLRMGKAEMTAFITDAGQKNDATPEAMYRALDAAQVTLEGWGKLLDTARCRFMVAASSAVLGASHPAEG